MTDVGTETSRRDLRRAEKQEREQVKAAEKETEQFADSPAGHAREARAAGEMFYQVTLPVSQRQHFAGASINPNGGYRAPKITSHAVTLGMIEAEGWRLESAGYVFEQTGQVSRDKFLSSGQQIATSGRVLGIYLFRAVR